MSQDLPLPQDPENSMLNALIERVTSKGWVEILLTHIMKLEDEPYEPGTGDSVRLREIRKRIEFVVSQAYKEMSK
ncbi:MAG: hypothetical protein GDA54_03725 [Alphaproteobacteria bacterium GM7ARS4]|nr:hypothetical protein [Alphaproteobacteria bacterium GM7ARS4]